MWFHFYIAFCRLLGTWLMCVTKQQVVFLQENKEFYSFTQTAIRFLQHNAKFWNLYPNGHSLFYNETQKFVNCNQMTIHVFATKYRILKLVHKRPFVFSTRKYEIQQFIINLVLFLKIREKFKNMISRYFVLFFYNEKRNYKHNWTLKYTLLTKRVIKI